MARPVGRNPEIRERILAAAMSCFEAHGYDATTMSMVVEASSVARRTVYGHFASKEELASAAARVQLDELLRAVPLQLGSLELADSLLAFNEHSVRWLKQNTAVAAVYMQRVQSKGDYSGKPNADQPSVRRRLRNLFQDAALKGAWPPDEDIEFLADGYALMWFTLCMQWLENRDDQVLQRRLSRLVSLYLGKRN